MTTLKDVHDYLLSKGFTEEELNQFDTSSVYLAHEIMEYAHRNQKRYNGDDYVYHPINVMSKYRHMVGIVDHDPFCIDSEMMFDFGIPFEGVQEVALLHDVIEDTEVTLEDVSNIYNECGLANYFNIYISMPLKLITHDKTVDYITYCNECCTHPTSALVKMIDMIDNLDLTTSDSINDNDYNRSLKYLDCIKLINDKYHFVEHIHQYRLEFAKRAK